MAQSTNDLTYAHESARFVERRARADLDQTLERLAARLEQAATVLRRTAGGRVGPPRDRRALPQLTGADEHLDGVALVRADATRSLTNWMRCWTTSAPPDPRKTATGGPARIGPAHSRCRPPLRTMLH